MPELPEVETVVRQIAPLVKNSTIRNARMSRYNLREKPSPRALATLADKQIFDVTRRGKYILVECNGGMLIVHLGMSGHLKVSTSSRLMKHDHFIARLDNGYYLRYHDPRRFGRIIWRDDQGNRDDDPLRAVGVEPLDRAYSSTYMRRALKHCATPIKVLLMEGKVVAGIGNIYANEILHAAKIHPQQPASTLSADSIRALVHHTKKTLRQAIAAGGSSIRDFVDSRGSCGYFQLRFRVYGRESEPCFSCRAAILRQYLRGRSTYFCPMCQPSPFAC